MNFKLPAAALLIALVSLVGCDDSQPSSAPSAEHGSDTSGGMAPVLRTDGKPTVGIGSNGPGSLYIDPINGGVGIDLGGGIGMPIG